MGLIPMLPSYLPTYVNLVICILLCCHAILFCNLVSIKIIIIIIIIILNCVLKIIALTPFTNEFLSFVCAWSPSWYPFVLQLLTLTFYSGPHIYANYVLQFIDICPWCPPSSRDSCWPWHIRPSCRRCHSHRRRTWHRKQSTRLLLEGRALSTAVDHQSLLMEGRDNPTIN